MLNELLCNGQARGAQWTGIFFANLSRQARAQKEDCFHNHLLRLHGNRSVAFAAGAQNDTTSTLPLVGKEFEAFVQRIAAEAGGSDAVSETPLSSEGRSFTESATSYSLIKGCYDEKDRVKAQERFWVRSE